MSTEPHERFVVTRMAAGEWDVARILLPDMERLPNHVTDPTIRSHMLNERRVRYRVVPEEGDDGTWFPIARMELSYYRRYGNLQHVKTTTVWFTGRDGDKWWGRALWMGGVVPDSLTFKSGFEYDYNDYSYAVHNSNYGFETCAWRNRSSPFVGRRLKYSYHVEAGDRIKHV